MKGAYYNYILNQEGRNGGRERMEGREKKERRNKKRGRKESKEIFMSTHTHICVYMCFNMFIHIQIFIDELLLSVVFIPKRTEDRC